MFRDAARARRHAGDQKKIQEILQTENDVSGSDRFCHSKRT